jgi:hypothetical protein
VFLEESDALLHLKGSTGMMGNPDYRTIVYRPGEGLTGTAFTQNIPFVYYRETKGQFEKTHISKFRENIVGKSKSIIFAQVFDDSGSTVGVIRCNNKEDRRRGT